MHRPIRLAAVLFALAAACGSSSPKPGPVLTSVTPAAGTVGTIVTIAGTGFAQDANKTNPTVNFVNGGTKTPADVINFTATSLDVRVPAATAANGTAFDVEVTNPGTAASTLPKSFTMTAPVLTDVNGGLTGSGTVGSLFIIDGQHFGDLAAAPASGYSVDFRDSASGSVVASATVDFAKTNWQDIFVVGTVPSTLTASTTYNVTVTTPSGTSAPLNFLVTGAVAFSPSTIKWSATTSLSSAEQGFGAVVMPLGDIALLYAVGGNTGNAADASGKTANVSTVFVNQFNTADGTLANTSWTPLTDLPDKRGFAAAVGASRFNSVVTSAGALYVMGGLDGAGAATSTVYTATLNAGGTIPAPPAQGQPANGSWTTTTALPQALYGTSAVIFHGRIYLAGGYDSSGAPSAKVYASKINPDGTLQAWQTLPDLPAAVAYHQLISANGYLYVLGGTNASSLEPLANTQSSAPSAAIYYQPINIRNGTLANPAWTTNASTLTKANEKFTAVVAGSNVLVSGGMYGNSALTGSSEQSYATLNSDGSISSFLGATGTHTISGSTGGYNFFNHAAVPFVDTTGVAHVIVIGGEDTNLGTPVSGVWVQH